MTDSVFQKDLKSIRRRFHNGLFRNTLNIKEFKKSDMEKLVLAFRQDFKNVFEMLWFLDDRYGSAGDYSEQTKLSRWEFYQIVNQYLKKHGSEVVLGKERDRVPKALGPAKSLGIIAGKKFHKDRKRLDGRLKKGLFHTEIARRTEFNKGDLDQLLHASHLDPEHIEAMLGHMERMRPKSPLTRRGFYKAVNAYLKEQGSFVQLGSEEDSKPSLSL